MLLLRHPGRLGQVVEVAGAAVSAARTGAGFASGSLGFGTTGQALSSTGSLIGTVGAVTAVAPALIGLAPIPVVGWVAAAVGALLAIFGGFFGGKPQLTHEQRDAIFVNTKLHPAATALINDIQAAKSLDELWTVFVRRASGYVGGTASLAIPVGIILGQTRAKELVGDYDVQRGRQLQREFVAKGWIILPTGRNDPNSQADLDNAWQYAGNAPFVGKPNPTYEVWSQEGFFSYLLENPDGLYVNIQAGVGDNFKNPVNEGVKNAILNQLQRLGFGRSAAGPATAPAGPDPTTAVTNWLGQVYQRLLGRGPSQAEIAAWLSPVVAQQVTPEQVIQAILQTPEFRAHADAVGPGLGPAPLATASTPLGTTPAFYAGPPTALVPIRAAAVIPGSGGLGDWIGQHPYLSLGVGGGLLVATLLASPPTRRRRR